METHSSVHAWRIPWTEEPGRLQSMGLQRGRHSFICLKKSGFLVEKQEKLISAVRRNDTDYSSGRVMIEKGNVGVRILGC